MQKQNVYASVIVVIAILFVATTSAQAQNRSAAGKWHAVVGAQSLTPRCDEIDDLAIGGEDGKTAIYSCRKGDRWQAAKGNQVFTPKCGEIPEIWWSTELRAVLYVCDNSIFVGNNPQAEDGPWRYVPKSEYCHRVGTCEMHLVHTAHRTGNRSDAGYADVSPKYLPDGTFGLDFTWTAPVPEVANTSDVVVLGATSSRFATELPPRIESINDGMPTQDPTRINQQQTPVVSCNDMATTRYLLSGTKPVWLFRNNDSKLQVCVDKTFGKAWDDTWDLDVENTVVSYFAKDASGWRLVHGATETPVFESVQRHDWVKIGQTNVRVFIAIQKAGESIPAVYAMINNQQAARVTKSTKLWRFIPTARAFAYVVQD